MTQHTNQEKGKREQGDTLELELAVNLLITTHSWKSPVMWKSTCLSGMDQII